MRENVTKTDLEWKRHLTPEQYRITRQKGTEPPNSGLYRNFSGVGTYRCMCCGNVLFSSEAKCGGNTKWPTFWEPIDEWGVKTAREIFHFMIRNEVTCGLCHAHLGYAFEDGRPPKGVRYYINSTALVFVEHDAQH